MYFRYAREQAGQFSSFLLDNHFTAQAVDDEKMTASGLQDYVSSIQESSRKWHEIYFPSRATSLQSETREWLERLNRLGRGAFEPLIMAALQKAPTDEQMARLLGEAERFIFTVSRLCARRADTGDSEFYRLAGQVFRSELNLAEAADTIREKADFHFSAVQASAHFQGLFEREDGFYGWGGLRYFLFEYEQRLREEAGMSSRRLDWNSFSTSRKDYVTIEHVYPVTPVSGEWPAFELRSDAERLRLRNSLGNLLALSQSRNSRFSNRPFARKKQDADGVQGYFNGSYSEIAVAQYLDWTPENVLSRGLKMLDFLEQRWSVRLGSHQEKLKLLNLEFLELQETSS